MYLRTYKLHAIDIIDQVEMYQALDPETKTIKYMVRDRQSGQTFSHDQPYEQELWARTLIGIKINEARMNSLIP